jgi:hypothetical protein
MKNYRFELVIEPSPHYDPNPPPPPKAWGYSTTITNNCPTDWVLDHWSTSISKDFLVESKPKDTLEDGGGQTTIQIQVSTGLAEHTTVIYHDGSNHYFKIDFDISIYDAGEHPVPVWEVGVLTGEKESGDWKTRGLFNPEGIMKWGVGPYELRGGQTRDPHDNVSISQPMSLLARS